MVEIIVRAELVGAGAIVTGYEMASGRPTVVRPVQPTPLTRVYRGFGKLRAETGQSPRRGFGTLIGGAEITDRQRNEGLILWLRVYD